MTPGTQLAFEAGRVFTPAAPINEADLFAGRTDQIRAVIDAVLQRGQHAIIFGERGVGKTSLANVLVEFLTIGSPQPAGRIIAPKVNCDGTDTFDTVWRKIFAAIPASQELPAMGFGSTPEIRSIDLRQHLPENVTPDAVCQLLAQIGRGPHIAIIVIDEFDRIKNHGATSLFADTVKTLSDQAAPVTLVFVGVADSVTELISEHESIERALIQIQMPRMSKPEIDEILVKGLERLSLEIDPDALDDISLLSQGLPHYAHLLGLNSAREAIDGESTSVSAQHVKRAIEKALKQAQQSIREAYHTAILSPRRDSLYRQVLLACALSKTDELGYFSPSDVRGPMSSIMGQDYDISRFARHLKEFTREQRGQILQHIGPERRTKYRFANPLMQPYVIMRGVAEELIVGKNLRRQRGD